MLHNEARKLLIQALEKTHNAREVAENFSVNRGTVQLSFQGSFRFFAKITGALLTRVTVVPTQPIKTLNLLRSERTVYAVSNS